MQSTTRPWPARSNAGNGCVPKVGLILIYADSGNGGHLDYRIELPSDDESKALVKRCLQVLALRFDDERDEKGEIPNGGIGLDQSVCNAARVWKLYGTMACKGDSLPERPHRMARILEAPESLEIVSIEQLQALAAQLPEDPPRQHPHVERRNYDGVDRYAQAALASEMDRVRSAAGGARNNTLNAAAFALGQLIGAGALERHTVEDELLDAAQNVGLARSEALKTIRSGIESGMREPREIPERKASRQVAGDTGVGAPDLDNAKKIIEAAIGKARAEDDPGAVFELEVIEALRLILEHNQAEYMRWRSKVKRTHKDVLITEIDRAVKGGGDGGDDQTIADSIIALVRESATLFHDPEGTCHASFEQNGHTENWPLGSKGFNDWCSYRAYVELGTAPSESTLKTVITALSGVAKHDGDEHDVFLRVARREDRYYLDLCNADWQVVEITSTGWQVLDNSPVKFRRTDAMQPLPIPIKDGDINLLWRSINIAKADRPLIKACILEAWRQDSPFPVIEFGGQQGSGKSDNQDRLRNLIDPSRVNLRAAPKSVEDIYVGAGNNWVVSFNNLSHLTANQQDAFCILATGGGFQTRTLYTNADETIIECQRPVIINGISTLATAQDLVDRVIRIDLPIIEIRRRDAELTAEFERNRPQILGGLLDLFVKTLAGLPCVEIAELPRMADFASLGEAMMQAEGHPPGAFLALYRDNQEKAVLQALESSPVASAVQEYIERNPGGHKGPINKLKTVLEGYRTEAEGWPRSNKGFADALRRNAPGLKILNIKVWFDPQRHNDGYHVHVVKFTRKADTSFSAFSKTDEQSSQHSQRSWIDEKTTDSGAPREHREHREPENPKLKKAENKVSPQDDDGEVF